MKQKVMVHVTSSSLRTKLLSIIVGNGCDFVEAFDSDDVLFKLNLLKNTQVIYVFELVKEHDLKVWDHLKRVRALGHHILLLIHHYEISVIDRALDLRIQDVVELPLEEKVLVKKLSAMNSISDSEPTQTEVTQTVVEATASDGDVNLEIQTIILHETKRALRGDYPLSVVMIRGLMQEISIMAQLKKVLSSSLRDTDMVLMLDEKTVLVLCPFTQKSYIVEVENKVRQTFSKVGIKGVVHRPEYMLYGLSYPEDVGEAKALLMQLEQGIQNSLMLTQLQGTIKDVGTKQFKAYRNLMRS